MDNTNKRRIVEWIKELSKGDWRTAENRNEKTYE